MSRLRIETPDQAQLTVERFLPVCDYSRMWVVTSVKYAEMVKAQLPMIPESHILSEPEPRNTAPCIAYACWKIKAEDPDANVVVTPSDAVVLRTERHWTSLLSTTV